MSHADPASADDVRLGRYLTAVHALPTDRAHALGELEACFVEGHVPDPAPVGPLRGRLLAVTVAPGFDAVAESLASVWMPWKGKTFEPDHKDGRNIFSPSWRVAGRAAFPTYHDLRPFGPHRLTAFRFVTWEGPGMIHPDVATFKIDYDLPESPAWPIRRVLDEVVRIGEDGPLLGQALLTWRGRPRRAAWFELS